MSIFKISQKNKKEEIINNLINLWKDPNNEVFKRISSFSKKSPNILKPILNKNK